MSCTEPWASRPPTTWPRSVSRQETVRSRSRAAVRGGQLADEAVQGGHALFERRHVRVPPSARGPGSSRPGGPQRDATAAPGPPAVPDRPASAARCPPAPAARRRPSDPAGNLREGRVDRPSARRAEEETVTDPAPPRPVPGPPRPGPDRPPDAPAVRHPGPAAPDAAAPRGTEPPFADLADAAGRRPRRGLRGRARAAAARTVHHRPALMVRRSRLDAELVRRGLARSREHAVTLIAEGRVTVGGQAATQAGHRGGGRHARSSSAPTPTSPAGSPAARTSCSARSRPSRSPVEGRRALDAGRLHRRVHRGAAAARRPRGRRRRRRLRRARLVAAHRRPGRRPRADQRPRADPRGHRRPGRAGRRRPVLHLAAPGAAGAHRLRRARRRPAADGQAAVRGRPGAARRRAASSAT